MKDWRTEDVTALPVDAVDEDLIDAAVEVVDGWFPTGNIDWEAVWDRLESYGWDLGDEFDAPGMRKIKREVRKRRADG